MLPQAVRMKDAERATSAGSQIKQPQVVKRTNIPRSRRSGGGTLMTMELELQGMPRRDYAKQPRVLRMKKLKLLQRAKGVKGEASLRSYIK